MFGGNIGPRGTLSVRRIEAVPVPGVGLIGVLISIWHGLPRLGLPREVLVWRFKNLPNLWRGAWRCFLAATFRVPFAYGWLHLRVIRADGTIVNYGTASMRVVTTAGATFLVDNLRASIATIANMKFHGIGTGGTAEAIGDTALVTELSTAYNPDNTRATGSQTNNGATVYRTVGTNTVDAGAAITEHGIFTQAATGGGTLLDRSLFSVVNLASGDSLQSTYDFTVNTGG